MGNLEGDIMTYLVTLFAMLGLGLSFKSVGPIHLLRLVIATIDKHIFWIQPYTLD